MTQIQLPPVAALPTDDTRFLAAARDIALLSDGLLAICDSPLLALTRSDDGRVAEDFVTLWCQRLEPCLKRRQRVLATAALQPVAEALHAATEALFDRLDLWGWDRADADGLTLVTDGTGVAITTRAPSGESGPAWLLGLTEGGDAATPILPFAAIGVWSMLVTEGARAPH